MFTQKNLLRHGLTFLVLLGTFHIAMTTGVPTAFAEMTFTQSRDAVDSFNEIAATINTFVHVLLLVILNLLGYLLQGDFFNNGNMMSSLNKIWILSRNIMNVIFALMLIGVAFYTIITAKAELIKTKWSQFVIAVILVNFSWFFPRVIIDVANVLTATVYSVPGMLPGFTCIKFNGSPCTVITKILILPTDAGPNSPGVWRPANGCTPPFKTCPCTAIACYKIENYAGTGLGNAHAMINGMTTSFINIVTLTDIPPGILAPVIGVPETTRFKETLQIVINILTVFFVQISLILPLVGLAVGLLIRILVLWITIAFMPFVFLGYVITGKLGTNIFEFKIDIWQEFINAAFLPAVVAVPFVIGFIMLSTAATIPSPPGFDQAWSIPLIAGVPSWWTFLWMMAAIGIIYVGAFTALAKSQITGKITDKISNFGKMLGGAALQLPLLAPLPVPIGGKKLNAGQLLNLPRETAFAIKARTSGGAGAFGLGGNPPGVPLPGARPEAVNFNNVEALQHNAENTQHIVNAIHQLATSNNPETLRQELRNLTNIVGGEKLKGHEALEQFNIAINNPAIPKELKDKINMNELRTAIEREKTRTP